MTRHVGVWIVKELSAEFTGAIPEQAIRDCVEGAIADLRGSTRGEALPEMAARLARVRLADMAATHATTCPRPGRARVRDKVHAVSR